MSQNAIFSGLRRHGLKLAWLSWCAGITIAVVTASLNGPTWLAVASGILMGAGPVFFGACGIGFFE